MSPLEELALKYSQPLSEVCVNHADYMKLAQSFAFLSRDSDWKTIGYALVDYHYKIFFGNTRYKENMNAVELALSKVQTPTSQKEIVPDQSGSDYYEMIDGLRDLR